MATLKQKKAFDKIMENNGNISKTMREVGYDEITAKNPKNLTDSLGWKELMGEYLSDQKLAEKHNELLNAVTISSFKFSKHDSDEDIKEMVDSIPGHELMYIRTNYDSNKIEIIDKVAYIKIPDSMAQDKALDKAYKLKGSYAAEKSTSVNLNIDGKTVGNVDTEALREEFENKLRGTLIQ